MAKKNWRAMTNSLRRRRSNIACAVCEFEWKNQKTNYPRPGGLCLHCYIYIDKWVKRGTNKIAKRLVQVQTWERRLQSTGAGKVRPRPKLKLVASGGRR